VPQPTTVPLAPTVLGQSRIKSYEENVAGFLRKA
jgi:hypothetical protein